MLNDAEMLKTEEDIYVYIYICMGIFGGSNSYEVY